MDPELRAFLTERFDAIDRRLDRVEERLDRIEARLDRVEARLDAVEDRLGGLAARLDQVEQRLDRKIDERFEEAKRHFGVLADGLRADIRMLAEGHLMLDSKLERFRVENDAAHREIGALIRTAYAALDRRATGLRPRAGGGEAPAG